MFIGREKELRNLELEWEEGSFAMPVIYGRRRIGKTSLLEKFAENKDTLFFTPGLNGENNISELVELAKKAGIETSGETLPRILKDIFKESRTRRFLFVIDEYPYLEFANKGTSSELQKLIDKNPGSRLFLVLCGSSMNFMKRQVLGYESPLFGRRTSQLLVEPFTLFEGMRFLPGANFSHACKLYGLVGGTPAYLSKLKPEKNLHENLLTALLRPSAYLFEENETLLKQELKHPKLHSEILKIINFKAVTEREIMHKMARFDIDNAKCASMIENLSDIGILEKVSAWREPKKEAWKIADCYFSFWHTFMPKIIQPAKNGQLESAANFVEKHYNEYMGNIFEKICVQWLKKEGLAGNLPIDVMNFGKWWGTYNARKKQAEIDIIADSFDGNMLFAECKWQNDPMDYDQLDKLVHNSSLVEKPKNCEQIFYFFSKSGFTTQMIQKAEKNSNCYLVGLSDMADESKETDANSIKIQL